MGNKSLRILMFAPAFAPFANPEAIVNSKLALDFINAGWDVDIISRNLSVESSYNYGSVWCEPWMPLKDKTHIVDNLGAGFVRRIYETISGAVRMHYPVEGCRWASKSYDIAMQLHKEKSYDIIVSRQANLPAMTMSRKTGIPWIANWNDPAGDKNPPPYGKGPDAKEGYFAEKAMRATAEHASWHTFPSERLRNYMCQYLGQTAKKKSSVIPHAALDLGSFEELKKNDVFTICHAGHISSFRKPDVFLEAFSMFIAETGAYDKVRLNMIGIEDVGITELAAKYGISNNISFMGPMPYMATLKALGKSDLLLIIEAPTYEGIYLPAKFVDYVQTGRPILAISPKVGTLNDLLSAHGGGLAVDCTDKGDIYSVLICLYEDWKNGVFDRKYSSGRMKYLYSLESILSSYENIFKEIGVVNK
jgi:glycosyltransferase involved in cell wall biosynthesis